MFLKIKILLFSITLFVYCNFVGANKTYYKSYFDNQKMESEGWLIQDDKVDYWFFYYENGNKKEEGHYKNNKKVNWWIFYNSNQEVVKKCEFKNNLQDGYAILYKKGNIVSAEKYKSGKKVKQWDSLSEFKKDNPIYFI